MTINLAVIGIPLGIIVVLMLIFSMWKKVPQDKAGVVTGLNRRVITGGGGFVVPGLERIDYISLGNIPLHVETKGSLSSQGVPISVCTTAVIKVNNSKESILTAIEQFVGKNEKEIVNNIRETANSVLEGKLREIIATMSVEDLYQKREDFSSKVQEVVGTELISMGLEVKNFTITDISDENGYIEALGEGMIAQRKKDAEVQKAIAQQEQDEKTSEAKRVGEAAKFEAQTKISEAAKTKAVNEAKYKEEMEKANAKADLAHEIQTKITEQEVIEADMHNQLVRQQKQKEVVEATIQVQIAESAKNTELKEQQAQEKAKELLSTIVEPAKADRSKQEQIAEAQKYTEVKRAEADAEKRRIDAEASAEKMRIEASAEAEAIKLKAQAEADAIKSKAVAEANAIEQQGNAEASANKAKGLAEAEAIKAKGLAEAEATRMTLLAEAEGLDKKAEAMQKMNDAGLTQLIVDKLPDIAAAIAAPMSQIDKISIIGGNGTGEVSNMIPTVLARTIESVKETTGFDLTDVMKAQTIDAKTNHNIALEDSRDK